MHLMTGNSLFAQKRSNTNTPNSKCPWIKASLYKLDSIFKHIKEAHLNRVQYIFSAEAQRFFIQVAT